MTTYCLPRYLLMVFAFPGDSTITRAFGILAFQNAAPKAASRNDCKFPVDLTTLLQSSCRAIVSPAPAFPAQRARQSTRKERYLPLSQGDRPNVWRHPPLALRAPSGPYDPVAERSLLLMMPVRRRRFHPPPPTAFSGPCLLDAGGIQEEGRRSHHSSPAPAGPPA